ncbi:MAG: polysaccharide export protein [Acidobacteria bacterium]|nr:MAG: polysaccharide export protein [Acidobacteriota bacterium]
MRLPQCKLAASLLISILAFPALSQNAAPTGTNTVPVASPTQPSSDLLIGSGDLIQVSVEGAPDYSRDVRVSRDGEIILPLIGKVKVGGLTLQQAQELIAARLREGKYFNDPQVTLFGKEYATQGISVLGEVTKPGIYPLLGTHTLFDAISAAGGVTPKAGKKVMILRRGTTEAEVVEMPIGVRDWSQSNVAVQPGDTVMVSKAGIVYVVGDVKLPGGYVMENSKLTVLQAVALAQGTNPTAALSKVKLIRKTPKGQKETLIALNKIYSAQIPDVNLEPEDILFIPNSSVKSGFRKALEMGLSTASGVAIYGGR